jgi:uncharacterized repeat protein (TIGR01451 family)
MTRRAHFIMLIAVLAGCWDAEVSGPPRSAEGAPPVAQQTSALVRSFGAGSLIIPMDTTSQNNGTLRAYGLVDALLRANVPVHRVSRAGKTQGAVDFSATVRQREGGASLGTVSYRAGPFVIDAADATPTVLALVDTYLASDTVTNVHEATAAFDADVQRTLVAAPRIAVLRDGQEAIAYAYLNAANIKDSAGNSWSNTSPGAITLAAARGATTGGPFDGVLLTGGVPAFDQLTSMHYSVTTDDELVREVRGWLSSSPNTHAHMQCDAILAYENNVNGRFLSTLGMRDDGDTPSPLTALQPASLFAQYDGTFTADNGSVNSLGLATGSVLRDNNSVLIALTGAPLGSRMVWLTGYIDGDTNKGKISYLTGHDYSTALPISSNPQTNGVRFFLNGLYETSALFATGQPQLAVTKSAPARTNATTITFTLTWSNTGNAIAYNAVLRDQLPVGMTFVSATGGGTFSSGTVTWNLGTLSPGASGTVSVSVSAPEGSYQNQATLAYRVGLTDKSVASNLTTTVVDRTRPVTTITVAPPNPTNQQSATFQFSASEPATFQCRLDGGAFSACTSPHALTGLAEGSHTFEVFATDLAGNVELTPASYTWTVDLTPPVVTLTSTPPAITNATSATVAFTVTGGAVTVECRLDTGSFAPCTSPFSMTGLGDGAHTVTVRATDAAGNVGTASFTWEVDTVPPTLTFTTVPGNPTNLTSATFGFSVSGASTVECSLDGAPYAPCSSPVTVTGLADGAHVFRVRATDAASNSTVIQHNWVVNTVAPTVTITSAPPSATQNPDATLAFTVTSVLPLASVECRLDMGPFTACTSPVSYLGLADGSHTFTVRATDAAMNVGSASALWLVDRVPPSITFTSTPPAQSNATTGTIAFTVSEAATVECRLNGGAFAPCTSPFDLGVLAEGSSTFEVRATDAAGNVGTASYAWVVDLTPPSLSFTSTPANPTNQTSASFAFTVSGATSVTCRLDSGAFSACGSPVTLSGLSDGSHTFTVRAEDAAGNVATISHTWVVDTVAPSLAFTSTPANPTNLTSATIAFTVSGATSVTCQQDSGAFEPCSSPLTLSGLADGSHTFTVRAEDDAGNVTTISHTWVVDTTPPDVTFTSTPPSATSSTSATLAFTVTGGAISVECSLDGAAFSPCTSPVSATGLADGPHTFAVRATDAVGNTRTVTHAWTVDTVPPAMAFTSTPSTPTNQTSATFEFTSGDATTVTCRLDGGAPFPCDSPEVLTGLSEGTHTLVVQGTDAAGNTTTISHTWVVDLTAPVVSFLSTPPTLTNSTSATFTFTTGDAVSVECSLDGDAFIACTSPLTIAGLGDGSHTLVIRARDAAGNEATLSHTWEVSTQLPTITITTRPDNPTNQTSATFAFTTSVVSTLECQLDSGAFATCTSPTTYSGLSEGLHLFTVRATDGAGNVATASYTWRIDTSPPDTSITSRPAAVVNVSSADFGFASNEVDVAYECSLDGVAFAACSNPATFTGLVDGLHVLLVRAVDAAGNADPSPAFATWTVDTVAPDAPRFLEPLTGATTGAFPRFGGVAEPGSTVTVLDGGTTVCTAVAAADGTWSCTSTTAFSGGMHSVTATATDAAGNTSQPSPPRAFTVDTSTPDTFIVSGPSGLVASADADFVFGSDRANATYECSLDGAAFSACTASTSFSNLADGDHRLDVRAVSGGLTDPSPATRLWTVDTTAPAAPTLTSPADGSTTSATPVFAGTAEPGSLVRVSVGSVEVCSARADATGAFSCAAPTAFLPGSYAATATATDEAGNTSSPSPDVTFTVDGSLLDTVIIAGPSGTVRSTTATFAFIATVVGATFECSLDGATFSACSSPTTFTGLTEGSHTFEVRAHFGGDVDMTPASRTWTVDATAPTAPVVVTPADGSTVYTRTPRYSGTAEPGSRVRVSVDDAVACTVTADAFGAWSCPSPTQLASGPHRVSAVAIDAAGNISPSSNVNVFTVDIPTVVVAITSPAHNTLTNDNTPTISGTASPHATVTVFVDGVPVGTVTADADGAWSLTPMSPLADGARVLTAEAEFMGHESPTSEPVTVRIDTRPPVVTLTVTQADPASMPTVTFSADESPVTFTCSVDGGEFFPCSSPLDVARFGDGNHTLVVRATDAAGNVGSASATYVLAAPLDPRVDTLTRGGGCACGSTDGLGAGLLGLAVLLFASQRRRGRLRRLTAVPALAVALTAGAAQAQVAQFDLERLDLNPGASASLVTHTGDLLKKGAWRASLTGHYQHEPLVLYRLDTNARLGAVVGSRVTAHVAGAWAPLDWLEVGLQLPIVLWQGGDDLSAWGVAAPTSTALGTPWLTGRFGLLRERGGAPLDLSVQLGLGLPFGSPAAFSNTTPIAFAPRLGVGKTVLDWLRLGGEVGFNLRGAPTDAMSQAVPQRNISSTFLYGLSATTVGDGLRGEVSLRGGVGLDGGQGAAELFIGARYPLGKLFEVYAIGGPGFGTLPGNPAFRVLAGVALQPPVDEAPPKPVCDASATDETLTRDCGEDDLDGDGVKNAADRCLRVAGVSAYEGCPVPDTDGDGLTDDVDACPTEAGLRERNGCPVRDRDLDGVEDADDACPDEAGPAERKGCPVRDRDQDGVEDADDACPDEAGPAERRGCPLKDQDGDGVEDAFDNCPTEKGDPANAGCPKKQKQLVIIQADRLVIKEKVFFATGKSTVLPKSFPLLNNVARVLIAHPEVKLVRIEGHTDSQGSRDLNLKLSQARAEAVKAYLVKQKVEAERLKAVGFGPDKPTATNDTPAGREQNRRVEFNFETPGTTTTHELQDAPF